jgi:hypothetical protein
MKNFINGSRFSHGILLILQIIFISGIFFTMHSSIANAGGSVSWLAILCLLLSIVLSIIFFQFVYRSSVKALQNAKMFESLKKSIQSEKKEMNATIEHTVDTHEIDYEAEAKAIFPKDASEEYEPFFEKIFSALSQKFDAVQAIAFLKNPETSVFSFVAGYAYYTENPPPTFIEGETLPGQVAKNKEILKLCEIPENYITIVSGLGKGSPKYLLIVPIFDQNNESIGVIELASFKDFSDQMIKLMEKISHLIGEHLITIGNSTKE